MKIHSELGPGLFESVYEATLALELKELGFDVKTQIGIPLVYKNMKFEQGFRLDILVENKVIIEIKSVKKLAAVHYKQLLTYLRLSEKNLDYL